VHLLDAQQGLIPGLKNNFKYQRFVDSNKPIIRIIDDFSERHVKMLKK